MIAANMLAPVGGVSHLRVIHPLRAIATDPSVTTISRPLASNCRAPTRDAAYLRPAPPAAERTRGPGRLAAAHASGWLLVTEFDDHPDFFPGMLEGEQLAFSGVHAVQTSTPALAALLRPRNPETVLFPNADRSLPEPRNFADAGPADRVLWRTQP